MSTEATGISATADVNSKTAAVHGNVYLKCGKTICNNISSNGKDCDDSCIECNSNISTTNTNSHKSVTNHTNAALKTSRFMKHLTEVNANATQINTASDAGATTAVVDQQAKCTMEDELPCTSSAAAAAAAIAAAALASLASIQDVKKAQTSDTPEFLPPAAASTVATGTASTTRPSKVKALKAPPPAPMRRLRKSTRSTRFRSKMSTSGVNGSSNNTNVNTNASSINNTIASKSQNKGGRSRRSLFKRPAVKTPMTQASTRFVTSVFHNDSYIQIGDIVSLVDGEQSVYYAQIRGLVVDAYCEKSAYLTWLIPTQDSPDPKSGFDPATYLIGPDEDFSRKLSFLQFVMHAPSSYYHDRTTPFPLPDAMTPDAHVGGYIWTRLGQYSRKEGAAGNDNAEEENESGD